MNRRGFFLGLAAAALCATTRVYGLATVPIRRKALLSQTNITLAEWSAQMGRGAPVAKMAELLKAHNAILDDMVFVSGKPEPFRRVTIRTRLPEVAWK